MYEIKSSDSEIAGTTVKSSNKGELSFLEVTEEVFYDNVREIEGIKDPEALVEYIKLKNTYNKS